MLAGWRYVPIYRRPLRFETVEVYRGFLPGTVRNIVEVRLQPPVPVGAYYRTYNTMYQKLIDIAVLKNT